MKNASLLAKIGADTAENEQHFAEILPVGHRVAAESRGQRGQSGTYGRAAAAACGIVA